jgi:hypothetical protein
VRIAALLVAKLRFERVIRGDGDAETWFEVNPEGFTEAFRRYCREVPPTAFSAQAEGGLWRDRS